MKTITLKASAVIAGAVRYPVEGPLQVSADEAERLIDADLAEPFDDDDQPKAKPHKAAKEA